MKIKISLTLLDEIEADNSLTEDTIDHIVSLYADNVDNAVGGLVSDIKYSIVKE